MSPSRARFTVIRVQTSMFLIKGSLHKIKVNQARVSQIETSKRKLNAQKSLQKRGSILVSPILKRSKRKHRDAAEAKLRKARKTVSVAKNKAKRELHKKGV